LKYVPGGGVHTALATSARLVDSHYGHETLYIGPDLWAERAEGAKFQPDEVQPALAAFAAERDVPVRFGRWNVDGAPAAALIDFGRLLDRKNRILGDLWNDFGVDSIHADWDTVERILFGYAAGTFLELHYHADVRPRARRAVAHFHQWMSARTTPQVATVYTPHGTALGRRLAGDGVRLRTELDTIEPASSAQERGMEAQHTLEEAAAQQASVLTVVNEQTTAEATQLLGRRPDLITPNGYLARERIDAGHRDEVRAAILRAAERFVGTPLDASATRIVFTSGRYEFHNKGFDIAIRALGRLRDRETRPPRHLLFAIFVSAPQTGLRHEVVVRLKRSDLKGEGCGICTHNLARPDTDPICKAAREAGLENLPDDPVHLIFCPVMLDGRDPLFLSLQLQGRHPGERPHGLPVALRAVGLHAPGEPGRRRPHDHDRRHGLRTLRAHARGVRAGGGDRPQGRKRPRGRAGRRAGPFSRAAGRGGRGAAACGRRGGRAHGLGNARRSHAGGARARARARRLPLGHDDGPGVYRPEPALPRSRSASRGC
jgi:phosphorylase/glycogen(starch) synthase